MQLLSLANRTLAFQHRKPVGTSSTQSDIPPARIEELIAALQAHRIQTLVDIRAFPMSRRLPHSIAKRWNRVCPKQRIRYLWMKALGGYRKKVLEDSPNIALRNHSFRNYADYMLTAGVRAGNRRTRASGRTFSHRLHVRRARVLPLPPHAGFGLAGGARARSAAH